MKNRIGVLVGLCFVCSSCIDSPVTLKDRVDKASVQLFISDAYRQLDPNAKIDSIVVIAIDTISEQKRLSGVVDRLFSDVGKTMDSSDWAKESIETLKGILKTQAEFHLAADTKPEDTLRFHDRIERLQQQEKDLRADWERIRHQIPNADSLQPVGYQLKFSYRVRSDLGSVLDTGFAVLDQNFKTTDKEKLYRAK